MLLQNAFALVCVGCAVFMDARLIGGPFVLDDLTKIENNLEIREIGKALMKRRVGAEHTSDELAYNDPSRPLVSLSFQLNYAWDGTRPNGYRFVNILIHGINAALTHALAYTIGGLTRSASSASGSTEALLTALLFLVAPLNHGTAVYVYARSDVMGASFTLLFTLVGLRALAARREAGQLASWKPLVSAPMLLSLSGALLCKQLALVVPVCLSFLHLVLIELPPRTTSTARPSARISAHAVASAIGRVVLVHLPGYVLVSAYVLYRATFLGQVGDAELIISKPGSDGWSDLACYWGSQPYAWVRTGTTLLVPVRLAIDHHVLQDDVCGTWDANLAAAAVLMLLALMVISALGRARIRGVAETLVLAGIGWLCISLLPSSLARTSDVYVERRSYVGSSVFYACMVLASVHLAPTAATATAERRGAHDPTVREPAAATAVQSAPAAAAAVHSAFPSEPARGFVRSTFFGMVAWWCAVSRLRNQTFYSTEAVWREVTFALLSASECLRVPPSSGDLALPRERAWPQQSRHRAHVAVQEPGLRRMRCGGGASL